MKRFIALIAALSAVMLFSLTGCKGKSNETASFTAPEEYETILQVEINPKLNVYLDGDNVILAVEYLNTDAETAFDRLNNAMIGVDLEAGMSMILSKAKENGFLTDGKDITVSIVECKEETGKSVLKTAADSVAAFTAEQSISANIKTVINGEEIPVAELENTDTPENVTSDTASVVSTVSQASKPANTTPANNDNEQAAAEQALLNPKNSLKKDTPYASYKLNPDGLLHVNKYTFRSNGEYSYSNGEYSTDSNYGGDAITYNGKSYYQCGGKGDSGSYTLTDEKIIVGSADIEFAMTKSGSLTVTAVKIDGGSEISAGDTFAK